MPEAVVVVQPQHSYRSTAVCSKSYAAYDSKVEAVVHVPNTKASTMQHILVATGQD